MTGLIVSAFVGFLIACVAILVITYVFDPRPEWNAILGFVVGTVCVHAAIFVYMEYVDT